MGFRRASSWGMSATIKREVIGGRVRHIFGGTDSLTATEVADLLAIECEHCYRAFEVFRALVAEQIAAIVAVEGGGKSVSGGRAAG